MRTLSNWVVAVVMGAVAGALILGVLGRLVMAGLALVMGAPTNLSAEGVLQVVVLGTVVGAVGGGVRQVMCLMLDVPGVVRGLFVGLALFVLSGMLSWWAGGLGESRPVDFNLWTLVVVAILYCVFGVVLESYLATRELGGRPRSR